MYNANSAEAKELLMDVLNFSEGYQLNGQRSLLTNVSKDFLIVRSQLLEQLYKFCVVSFTRKLPDGTSELVSGALVDHAVELQKTVPTDLKQTFTNDLMELSEDQALQIKKYLFIRREFKNFYSVAETMGFLIPSDVSPQ